MNRYVVAKPWLGIEESKAASEAILSGWVTQGPKVKQFEYEFATYVGAIEAVAVSSCTTALHLALLGAGVEAGDIVATVSHSFIATANAIRHVGAEPYFLDIDSSTHNIDPEKLELFFRDSCDLRNGVLFLKEQHVQRLVRAVTPLQRIKSEMVGRVAAVLVVHQTGNPAPVNKIAEICRPLGVKLVEDAACAIGSSLIENGDKRMIGNPFGDSVCFSFHPRKLLTTGDGGMITTNDPVLADRLRKLRQHGMSVNDLQRHNSAVPIIESYDETGFNYRLTDIHAGVGLVQLRRLPDQIAIRSRLAKIYIEEIGKIPGFAVLESSAGSASNWQSLIVLLPPKLNRLEMMARLKERGVDSRRGVMCAHLEPPYRAAWSGNLLENSERASERSLILPLYAELTEADVQYICDVVREVANV